MEDDASCKQCQVVVDLAEALSEIDPELGAKYAEAKKAGVAKVEGK